jgi:hypothetical protein
MHSSKALLIPLLAAALSAAGAAAGEAPAAAPAAVPAGAPAPVAAPAAPTEDAAAEELLQYVRGAINERKGVVLKSMLGLTPEQQTAFDPVLAAYDAKLKALGDRRLALIKEYAAFYNNRSLDDKNAKRLVLESIKVKQDQLSLYKEYFDKAAKVIGVTKASEFIQVENAFAGAVDLKLALEMPRVSSAMKQ